jgi:ubiquinone/menaquinone biosynthesis C-methylase UbiE
MNNRSDQIWQAAPVVRQYLESVRGAIPLAAEQIEVMLRLVAARDEPVRGFLDLGCGDGILAAAILAQYPTARGVLLDFSRPMLEIAQEKLGSVAQNLQFVMADFSESDWLATVVDRAPFEVIVSGYAIHHQPDERKQSLYAEIYELLTPGGLFVNIEHVASATPWLEWIWDEYFIDTLHAGQSEAEAPGDRARVAQAYQERPDQEANILAPVEQQCDWLRRIGFEDVDCYFKVFELAVFGGRRAAE